MVFLSGLAGPSLKVEGESNPRRVPPSSHEADTPVLFDRAPSLLGFARPNTFGFRLRRPEIGSDPRAGQRTRYGIPLR